MPKGTGIPKTRLTVITKIPRTRLNNPIFMGFFFERILMRIKQDGLSLDEYKLYLEYAKVGFVPSAGVGLGVERLTRFLVGASHIGEIQAFRRVPGEMVVI